MRAAAAWLVMLGCAAAIAQTRPESDGERERFLRDAEVVKWVALKEGTTDSKRATLRLGGFVHDAHLQDVDIQHQPLESLARLEPGFTDSYRYNIAAYELDRLLGLGMVPVTVYRKLDGTNLSVTWWVDDTLMNERERLAKKIDPPDAWAWTRQVRIMRVFDQLIYNVDRNVGNIVIDQHWKLWMIDHTRSFRDWVKLTKSVDIERIDRVLYARLKALDRSKVEAKLGTWLSRQQIDGLMGRRDLIVRGVEERIGRVGEQEVLYDWLPQ